MKKLLHTLGVIYLMILALFSVSGCEKEIIPNGKIEYAHVSMVIDERDLRSYIGIVDYVFIGTIQSVENVLTEDFTDTVYQITVEENLKGSLEKEISAYKHGGYAKDGTLRLYASDYSADSGIRVEKDRCIFMAYGQSNGDLLLAEINGDALASDETVEQYRQALLEENPFERKRFPCKYDVSYQK